ncbi:cation efflux family-domain-containing protein [Cunninghamella echinulata]|nr:cation efflux family-domain-containing protein [Cunninghamella echinulata]
MQSTRRVNNKRQPIGITSLPLTTETNTSLGTKGVDVQTSAPLYHSHPSSIQNNEQSQANFSNNFTTALNETPSQSVYVNNESTTYSTTSNPNNTYNTPNYDNHHIEHNNQNNTNINSEAYRTDNNYLYQQQQQHVDHNHNHNHHNHSHSHSHTEEYNHQINNNFEHSQHNDNINNHHHDHHHAHDHQIHEKHGHHQDHHSHDHHHHHAHDNHHHAHDSHHHHDHSHDHHHDHHDHHHHDHDDHHHHHHTYPTVFIPPLPSWSELFSTLLPAQKTIFTWFVLHMSIGVWVYCLGISNGSLAAVGFAYLVIFDALGVLNSFVSSVIRTSHAYSISNSKRPFGAHRYEIIFSMATAVYLLYATMHNTKESLEHFLLEGHHGGDHHEETSFGFGMILSLIIAVGTCCLSSIALRNHENFVQFLRRTPPTVHGFSYNVINRARGNPINVVLSNVYSFSIAMCGTIVLLANMFGLISSMDKLIALGESLVMFYLGYPTAKALANVLLQTTPNSVRNGVENRLREIRQNPNIISIERVHFWQNTYGKCVGTLEVHIRPDADDQAILQYVYQKLEGLTTSSSSNSGDNYNDNNQRSELTVSVIKN